MSLRSTTVAAITTFILSGTAGAAEIAYQTAYAAILNAKGLTVDEIFSPGTRIFQGSCVAEDSQNSPCPDRKLQLTFDDDLVLGRRIWVNVNFCMGSDEFHLVPQVGGFSPGVTDLIGVHEEANLINFGLRGIDRSDGLYPIALILYQKLIPGTQQYKAVHEVCWMRPAF